jgi:hypothetical protein
MIFKYDLTVSGDNFYPDKILSEIQGDFMVDSCFNPTDKKFIDNSVEYGYGGISFWHPQKFSTEDRIENYEKEFIEFIEKNYTLFVKNGVNGFVIFIEIYFDGGQCNFEIFNTELLKKLGTFGISLPISIYVLKTEEIQKWEDEIKLVWESR